MSRSRPIALGFKILSAQKMKRDKNGKKEKLQKWKETYN